MAENGNKQDYDYFLLALFYMEINWFQYLLYEHKKRNTGPYYLELLPPDIVPIGTKSWFQKQVELVCPYRLIPPLSPETGLIDIILKDIQSVDSNIDYTYSIIYINRNKTWCDPVFFISNKTIASMLVITYNYESWNGE